MTNAKPFFSIPIKENKEKLIKLNTQSFAFVFDRDYVVRESVSFLLLKASKKLPSNHKFKILDSWRSIEMQREMVNKFMEQIKTKNPNWPSDQIEKEVMKFASPVTGELNKPPPHSTGGAVDLTIVDGSGKYLRMDKKTNILSNSSSFNHFGSRRSKLEQKMHQNRVLLRDLLTNVGFAPNDNEWWHFDYGNQRWAYFYNKPYAKYGSINN